MPFLSRFCLVGWFTIPLNIYKLNSEKQMYMLIIFTAKSSSTTTKIKNHHSQIKNVQHQNVTWHFRKKYFFCENSLFDVQAQHMIWFQNESIFLKMDCSNCDLFFFFFFFGFMNKLDEKHSFDALRYSDQSFLDVK